MLRSIKTGALKRSLIVAALAGMMIIGTGADAKSLREVDVDNDVVISSASNHVITRSDSDVVISQLSKNAIAMPSALNDNEQSKIESPRSRWSFAWRNEVLTGAAAQVTPTLDKLHQENPTDYPNDSAYYLSEDTPSNYTFYTTDGMTNTYYLINNKESITNIGTGPSTKYFKTTVLDSYGNLGLVETTSSDYTYKINYNPSTDAVGLSQYNRGGAIYNTGTMSNINKNFISNSAEVGGAIYNNGIMGDIVGNFINNRSSDAYAGAILCEDLVNHSKTVKIGNIIGNFIGNYVHQTYNQNGSVVGGAMRLAGGSSNTSEVKNIIGNFINNYTYTTYNVEAGGGAMNITRSNTGNIIGDFIGNYAYSPNGYTNGGALDIYSNTSNKSIVIGDIIGDYIGNYAAGKSYSRAGAILIFSNSGASTSRPMTIGNIIGNQINNYAYATNGYAVGGAVVLLQNAGKINTGDMAGDYISNYAKSGSSYAYGGAIYNLGGNIKSISGNFISNYTDAYQSSYGGVIYNTGTVTNGIIDSNFINNYAYARNSSYSALGGAIYNSGNLTLGNDIFEGNYIQKGSTKTPNSIYNSGVINIAAGKSVTINDGWQSSSSGQLVMLGSDSVLNINIGNGTIQQDSLGKITNIGTINATVDLDLSNISSPTSDTITVSSVTQPGFINITGLNLKGDYNTYKGHEFTKRILINSNNSSNLQLNIAMAISGDKYVLEQGEKTAHTDDININTNWNDTYEAYNLSTDIVGTITTTNSTTTNDSITFTVTGTQENKSDTTVMDTLKVVNQSDLVTRNFNATTDGELYTVSDNLGTTGAGTVTINGKPDGATSNGTIDLASLYSGFELDKATIMNLNDVVIQNAKSGSAIVDATSEDAVVNLSNTKLDGNVINAGTLNIGSNSKISGTLMGTGTTNINADYTLNHVITGNNVTLNNDAELTMGTTGMLSGANSFTVNSGSLNLQNGVATNTDLGNLVLNSDLDLKIDGEFASKQIDTITVNSITPNDNHINISNVNILTPTTDELFSISPIGEMSDAAVRAQLANTITYTAGDLAMTPIYKYHVDYNPEDAMLKFTRYGGLNPGSGDFNPAVIASPVTTQASAASTMNITTEYSFNHSDTFFNQPYLERMAQINNNVVAMDTGKLSFSSTDYNENLGHIDLDHTNKGVWVKPYTVFENVPLKNGPKINAITYGTLIGYDSDFRKFKHGWAGVTSGFVGYTGSQVRYSGVDTSSNGGMLGLTQTWYKNNFFTALTVSTGAMVGETHSMYGREDSTTLMAGLASKTGYNFEFKQGKFIIQPLWMMSYSFINTFDYTNAAGVKIKSKPMNTIQLNPSIKFIGNIEGWQPYATVGMVWNLMNETNVTANGVKLPGMSVKPYVEYGVGLQRCWKDKFSAFGQAMIRNGGRNGIALTAGFRIALGSDGSKTVEKVQKQSNEQKVANKKVIKQKVYNKTIKTKNAKVSKISEFFAKMDGELLSNSTITP